MGWNAPLFEADGRAAGVSADRIACCVPGCRRTIERLPDDPPHVEIICGKHWRAVTPSERRHIAKIRRLLRRRETASLIRLHNLAWQRCKALAIDAAQGRINDADLAEFLSTI